jgi:hypothetical protein
MKRNEMLTRVYGIGSLSLQIGTSEEGIKSYKQQAREEAVEIVNQFKDDDSGLIQFLNDAFSAMSGDNFWGIGTTTKQKQSVSNKKQNTARFFHRAFNDLKNGFTLSGSKSFVIKAVKVQVNLTVNEMFEKLGKENGIDTKALQEIDLAVVSSQKRTARRESADLKVIKQLAVSVSTQKAETRQAIAIEIVQGMSALQKEELLQQLQTTT